MGWRRDTWVLLGWLALTIGALALIFTKGAVGLGLAACEPPTIAGSPWGECGDAGVQATGRLILLVLLVGGIGLLVIGALWARSRPALLRCPGCSRAVGGDDATCPACGRHLYRAFGPPPGWGRPRSAPTTHTANACD